jgi:large subunit ribosomal protein L44e
MKIPKSVKHYCPSCKKHTLQNIIQNKSGKKRGAMTQGARRHERRGGINGFGGFPRPQPEKSPRHRKKTTKRIDMRLECPECKKKSTVVNTFRIKKFEIVKTGV